MKDKFNEPDVVNRLISWSDTRSARLLGRRSQLGLGIVSSLAGVALFAEGLLNRDGEHIVGGLAGMVTGGFLTKHADIQIEQLNAEIPQSQIQ